jgi:hypothetical protein
METTEMTDYRIERWIAIVLALLFFVPFIANAQPAPAAVTVSYNGSESSLRWVCKNTNIDDFRQCALMLDDQLLTWRMAPAGEELTVQVRAAGDFDHDSRLDLVVDITRGRETREARFLSTRAIPPPAHSGL